MTEGKGTFRGDLLVEADVDQATIDSIVQALRELGPANYDPANRLLLVSFPTEAATDSAAKDQAIQLIYERVERFVPWNRVAWRRADLWP